jgi:formylmethanofuran dehydrogenase subunit A
MGAYTMLTKLAGATIYDPVQGLNGEIKDLYILDGRLIPAPGGDEHIDQEYNLHGKVVMAGAVDLHTHIGGGKVNVARSMLARDAQIDDVEPGAPVDAGIGVAVPSTVTAGYRYAEMGYTTCFEPAVIPVNARQSHMEMADTPIVDTGGYTTLGNDDFLLKLLSEETPQSVINDYVAWTLRATQCIGVKIINAGGINAFKFNVRKLNVDEQTPHYGVRPRDIIRTLSRAITELHVPFPVHVHASNLGVAGNVESTLATIDAAEGHRIHLTHVQFHSYGTEGKRKFSSAADRVAEAVNESNNVTLDVGQVMFGQTVTLSADTMQQYKQRTHAHPNKWICMDIECESGCGVLPFHYRDGNFVNALQWAIGLEIFLLVNDPWRVCLTTDHPNGAPFTTYPHLVRLLMDKSYRADMLATIHPDAAKMSHLRDLTREYSLNDIAIMTRAAPARLLGLKDKGHLGVGAAADITVYQPHDDQERMFAKPALVFKDGELVVKDGRVIKAPRGRTQVVRPEYDASIEQRLKTWFDNCHTVAMRNYQISDGEMAEGIGTPVVAHPCKAAS